MPAPFIGIGTGRCGTRSLKEILNHCKNVQVVHEVFLQPWYPPINAGVLHSQIAFLNSDRDEFLRGAVSLTSLHVVTKIRRVIPDLKVVHIYRDRDEVANSFTVNHLGVSRAIYGMEEMSISQQKTHWKANPWIHPLAGMPEIFPKFDVDDCMESYKMYWDLYMETASQIKDIYTIHMMDLNNDKELKSLFEYLSIHLNDRYYPIQRLYNKTEEDIINAAKDIIVAQ